jgi:RecB family exonuclease
VDVQPLKEELAQAWESIGFDAPWQATSSLPKAEAALETFFALHRRRQEEGHQVWAEQHFDTTMEVAGRTVRISGNIDRIELTSDGRVRIVDIKTGTTAKGKDEVVHDPQLGLYQWAVNKDLVDLGGQSARDRVDGAELVYPSKATAKGVPTLREQPALATADASDPEALDMDALIDELVNVVASNLFVARPDENLCRFCDFQQVCPAKTGQARVVP